MNVVVRVVLALALLDCAGGTGPIAERAFADRGGEAPLATETPCEQLSRTACMRSPTCTLVHAPEGPRLAMIVRKVAASFRISFVRSSAPLEFSFEG